MNNKAIGEKGVRIAIGELAKYNVNCAIPLTDNETYDLILIYNNKLFKAQVKTSFANVSGEKKSARNAIKFSTSTSNWYASTITKYKKGDFDIMIGVDLINYNVYLIEGNKVFNKRTFSIRTAPSKNGQKTSCNMKEDYILSEKRVSDILVPSMPLIY